MKCAVQIYMVLGGFHVYKSVFLGWVVGRFNIAVNGEHNCGVLPYAYISESQAFRVFLNNFLPVLPPISVIFSSKSMSYEQSQTSYSGSKISKTFAFL